MPSATWFCDVCGSPWKECEDALACEKGHTHAMEILKEQFDPNECYLHEPDRIQVIMSDGKHVWYDKSTNQ
jgi:hypothetical protein